MSTLPPSTHTFSHAKVRARVVRNGGRRRYRGFLLKQRKHDPVTVTMEAVRFFSRPLHGMLPEQVSALHTIQQAIAGWRAASQNDRGVPGVRYIKRIISAMGCLFFFDTLYSVKFVWDSEVDMYGYHTVEHVRDRQGGREQAKIVVNPFHAGMGDVMGDVIGTLLHECCHAFQTKFFCRGTRAHIYCEGREQRVMGSLEDAEWNGHGSAWYILASHVEARASELFGREFKLGPPTIQLTNDMRDLGTFPNEEHRQLCHPIWQSEMLDFCQQAAWDRGVALD